MGWNILKKNKYMLATKLSPHLQKLVAKCPAVYREFVPSDKEGQDKIGLDDPLCEEAFTATRGLVHKYDNRALILLTMNCAAYCRFCTRRRSVSDVEKGIIRDKDIDNMAKYLKKHPEITEIIFSGGDPMTVPVLLYKAMKKLASLPQLKIIRVGTRVPVSHPQLINAKVLSALKLVKNKPLYILINFEHPDEITKETEAAINKLQKVSTMLLSQSVSLRGVNDKVETLYKLFTRLVEIGVKPYYFYRCDPVKGAEHFIVPFKKEVKMFTELRSKLSGLATPLYVIDAPNGSGKIPVALDYWQFDKKSFRDFKDKKIKVWETSEV